MRGRRKPDGFFCYLVGWDDMLMIKAGVSFYRSRPRMFVNRGATLYGLHDSERWVSGSSSVNLESHLAAALDDAGCTRAFHEKAVAAPYLGGGGCGYMECAVAPNRATYLDAVSICLSIMREHPVGHCVSALLPADARTDGRTDSRRPVPTTDVNHKAVDAHAHTANRAIGGEL